MTKYLSRILDIAAEKSVILELLQELNPTKERELIESRLDAMQQLNYFIVGCYDDQTLVGLTGCWHIVKIFSGLQFELDNFIVTDSYRGKGVGAALIEFVKKEAHKRDATLIALNSYNTLNIAHHFYQKHGFSDDGKHFMFWLKDR